MATTDTASYEPTGETTPLLQLRAADARRLRDLLRYDRTGWFPSAMDQYAERQWAEQTLAAAIDLHDRATAEGEAGR